MTFPVCPTRLALVLIVGVLAGCSSEEGPVATTASTTPAATPRLPPPTPEEAGTLIGDSAEFSEFEFTNAAWSLPLQGKMMNAPASEGAKELAREGWIKLDREGNVTLTEKAKKDRRWLVRPNGFVDLVPIARKEVSEVRSVIPLPDGTLSVDFSWRWIPNEVGSAFKSGMVRKRFDSAQNASAQLTTSEGKWQILSIVQKSGTAEGKE